jgi:hypothetical protein
MKQIKTYKRVKHLLKQFKSIVQLLYKTNMSDKEILKPKRGRKSKKDLMAALGVAETDKILVPLKSEISVNVSLNISDMKGNDTDNDTGNNSSDNKILEVMSMDDIEVDMGAENEHQQEPKQTLKKRGRKPKGGKIIPQVINAEGQKNEKPNIILHLKCSTKDLQSLTNTEANIESYTFNNKSNLSYEIIGGENINKINQLKQNKSTISTSIINSFYNDANKSEIIKADYDHDKENDYENDDYEFDDSNKEIEIKEIWRKLKLLEHDLHINNVNNKKSACFWDTCEFDNPPVYIPKHFINESYNVYGCFCCPECAVAYLMNENIDSSTKFERYHLLNHIYSKIYDYQKNIKPSPTPYYMLDKYYGNLSIQEYRMLVRNERLFLIVDKPLTRILPELHDDNDDFILNNKIIPSNNNYQLKSRMQRKKPTKSSILNEKFSGNQQSYQTTCLDE